MKRSITTVLLLCAIACNAQNIIYEKQDSIIIENIIKEVSVKDFTDNGKMLLAIADRFIGEKYIAGTLENGEKEPLFISCSQFDCTTFIELILAIGVTTKEKMRNFHDVCKNLEKIRYRNGIRKGYTSRLHYISWWIADSIKQEFINEVTSCKLSIKSHIDLSFMSRNPSSYTMLKNNPGLINEIKALEAPFCNKDIEYIPKEMLNRKENELPIKDGDILALTTNIKGLDVTHVGFAFWKKGVLHLLHASSRKGEVIRDNESLYNYMKRRKQQSGVRVFRIK